MKKIVCLVLIMCLASFSTAFAESTEKIVDIDQQLIERGYPIEVINTMPNELKKETIELNLVYESHSKTDMSEQASLSSETVSTRGTISSSKMDMYSIISKYQPFDTSQKKVRVSVYFDWDSVCIFNYHDQIGMAVDDDWYYYSNSAKSYVGYYDGSGMLSSETNRTPMDTNGGMIIEHDMHANVFNEGYAAATFKCKNPSSNGTFVVSYKYLHKTTKPTVSLNLMSGQVIISGTTGYDYAADTNAMSY